MCVRSKENEKKTNSHQTLKKHNTKYIHSSPATATTSRRRAVKHVPLGSPYSHSSSIDPGFVESASLVCTRMYILALLLLLRRLCTFWFSILFSGQRSFVFLCSDTRMYLRFRGCPVVLDIELSVSAWYITRLDVYCCARGVFCCWCFLQQRAKSGGLRCAA